MSSFEFKFPRVTDPEGNFLEIIDRAKFLKDRLGKSDFEEYSSLSIDQARNTDNWASAIGWTHIHMFINEKHRDVAMEFKMRFS